MIIKSIEISNFLGVNFKKFDMAALTIIAGPNFTGKTTISDAIALALIGRPCRGVVEKKDLKLLVTEGANNGEVVATWADRDGERVIARMIPSMKRTGFAPAPAFLRFLLDMDAFSGLTLAERQVELMHLQGRKVDLDDIKARALKRGCSSIVVEKVAIMALTGFEAVVDDAKDRARTAKAAWRGVTGEAWGAGKAVGWEAPAPETQRDVSVEKDLREEHAKKSDLLAEVLSKKNNLEAVISSEIQRLELVDKMNVAVAGMPGLVEKEQKTADAVAVEKNRLAAAVEFLAMTKEKTLFYICPHCDTKLIYDRERDSMIAYTGDADSGVSRKEIPEIEKNVAAQKKQLRAKEVLLESYSSEILQERAAMELLASMKKEEMNLGEARQSVVDLTQESETLSKRISEIQSDLNVVDAVRRQAADALEITALAENYNLEISEWTKAAEVFGPEGIPLELVNETLAPFNDAMERHAERVGWAAPHIRPDMEVMQGNRLHQLLSKSEKWRVNALLSVVIAETSGVGFAVFDEFDVLEPGARGPAMGWLHEMEIQTIVLMTAKKAPLELDGTRVYWLGKK